MATLTRTTSTNNGTHGHTSTVYRQRLASGAYPVAGSNEWERMRLLTDRYWVLSYVKVYPFNAIHSSLDTINKWQIVKYLNVASLLWRSGAHRCTAIALAVTGCGASAQGTAFCCHAAPRTLTVCHFQCGQRTLENWWAMTKRFVCFYVINNNNWRDCYRTPLNMLSYTGWLGI